MLYQIAICQQEYESSCLFVFYNQIYSYSTTFTIVPLTVIIGIACVLIALTVLSPDAHWAAA